MTREHFNTQEMAVLLATRCSKYAQSARQLAQNAEASGVQDALESLKKKGILIAAPELDIVERIDFPLHVWDNRTALRKSFLTLPINFWISTPKPS